MSSTSSASRRRWTRLEGAKGHVEGEGEEEASLRECERDLKAMEAQLKGPQASSPRGVPHPTPTPTPTPTPQAAALAPTRSCSRL